MNAAEFMREEYLTLRKEVESSLTDLASTERNCVVAIAAIYAWLVTKSIPESLSLLAWSIPVFLAAFGGLRSYTIGQHLRRLSEYLRKIELEAAQKNTHATGWEHFHTEASKTKLRTKVAFLSWLALLILTVVAACYGPAGAQQTAAADRPEDAARAEQEH